MKREAPRPPAGPQDLLESDGVSASAILTLCRYPAHPPCSPCLSPTCPGQSRASAHLRHLPLRL